MEGRKKVAVASVFGLIACLVLHLIIGCGLHLFGAEPSMFMCYVYRMEFVLVGISFYLLKEVRKTISICAVIAAVLRIVLSVEEVDMDWGFFHGIGHTPLMVTMGESFCLIAFATFFVALSNRCSGKWGRNAVYVGVAIYALRLIQFWIGVNTADDFSWLNVLMTAIQYLALSSFFIQVFRERDRIGTEIDKKVKAAFLNEEKLLRFFADSTLIIGSAILYLYLYCAYSPAEEGVAWDVGLIVSGLNAFCVGLILNAFTKLQIKVKMSLMNDAKGVVKVSPPVCTRVLLGVLYVFSMACGIFFLWSIFASDGNFIETMSEGVIRNMSFGMFENVMKITIVMSARSCVAMMALFMAWYSFGLGKLFFLIGENSARVISSDRNG